MSGASGAFRSLRRILGRRYDQRGCCCSYYALAEKQAGNLQEAMNGEELDHVTRKVSCILIGPRTPPSLQRFVCSPELLLKHVAFFKGLGIHLDGFCKIISVFPHALVLDPETDLKFSVDHLRAALGTSLLTECIMSWPPLLGLGFQLGSAGKSDLTDGNDGLGFTFPGLSGYKAELSPKEDRMTPQLCPKGSVEEVLDHTPHSKILLPEQDFSSKVYFLLKCGFKRNSRLLARALFCALHTSKQDIDAILHALMILGLSHKYSCRLIRLQPPILQQRPAQITLKLDYILNTMGFSVEELFKYSSFMIYDLDTHIRPRYLMHAWIKSKRLLRRNFKLDYIMSLSEKQFLRKFVESYEGGANVYHGLMQSPLQN